MKQRILSGLVMAPLLLMIWAGGLVLWLGAAVIAFMAAREYARAFKGETPGSDRGFELGVLAIYAVYMAILMISPINASGGLPLILFVIVLFVLIDLIAAKNKGEERSPYKLTGYICIGYFSLHIVAIAVQFTPASREFSCVPIDGFQSYVWLVILSAFGCDIFAYFTGMAFGKHKLCPNISPKKTVEGAVGGVLGSILLCGLFGYFLLGEGDFGFVVSLISGVLGGITAQLGDLNASIMKRRLGIKDWGTLIPGHGGVLDRIDSVLFTAPTVYYVLLEATAIA